MKLIHAPLLALAFATPVNAQDGDRDPLSLIPSDAMFVMWVDGPASIAEAFEDTRLSRLLGGPELQGMLTPLLDATREEWRGPAAKLDIDLASAEEALLAYRGRVWGAFGFDTATMVETIGDDDRDFIDAKPWFVIVFSSDGETDLAAAADAYDRFADELGDDVQDRRVSGKTFRVTRQGKAEVTMPFMAGSHLVMVVASDLDAALEQSLWSPGQSLAGQDTQLPEGPLGMWAHAAPFVSSLREVSEVHPNGEVMVASKLILDGFGLGALRTFSVTASPAGEHTNLLGRIGMGEGDHGVLGALFGAPTGAPESLDLIPVQRDTWSVQAWRPDLLYDGLAEIAEDFAPFMGQTRAGLEDEFTQFFRVRLKEDLIDHLGTEFLSVGSGKPAPEDADDVAEALSGIEGQCWALTLSDPVAFGESFEKLIRSRGLHAARKTEDYRGFLVRRITVLGSIQLFYAVTDRVFATALGEDGGRELRAILDEERDRSEGIARAPFPPEVEERLDHAGTGWNGIGVGSLSTMAQAVVTVMEQDRETFGGEGMAVVREGVDVFLGLIDRYDLKTVVTLSRTDGKSYSGQFIW